MAKKLDKVDVVTVGVGWTGGIIAAELTKAGYKVVGLERGQDRETKDYFNLHDELKYVVRKELMQDLSDDTITHRNNLDQTAHPVRDQPSNVLGTGVGGAGIHWAGQSFRYFPYDFEIKNKTIDKYGKDKIPKDMTLQNWGITYDEIEPYYDKFEKTIGVSGEEAEFTGKRSDSYPLPPLKKTPLMGLFEKATKNLGYHPYIMPAANASEAYENPDGQKLNACEYCAFCQEYGCEHDAKGTPGVTVIPTAQETGNYELRTNAKVKRILYEDNQATGVLYEDTQTGEEYEQPADIVALTAYTFSNIKLLLLSEIGEPYNPKTSKGIIGKNFTEHTPSAHTVITGFFDQKFNLYASSGALGMTFEDYNADNFDHSDLNFIHGGNIEVYQGDYGPIANNPVPEGTPAWGEEFKKNSIYYYFRTTSLLVQFAIPPFKGHYVDLDPTYTDDNGDPLLRVTFDYSDNDRNLSKFLADKAEGVLKEMGADIVDKNPVSGHYEPDFSWGHSAGGAIMGDNPETSAVNNYWQMWEMDNLFVCGAATFPHFPSLNPTLTIGALTYRAAEGMIEYLESGGQLVGTKEKKKRA